MLLKSQFVRRLRNIPESVWRGLMKQLVGPFPASDSLRIYRSDSFPVSVCRNIRIKWCKIIKMNRSVDIIRNSVEVFLPPGSRADVNALYDFCFSVDARIVIYGDMAYNAHAIEYKICLSNIFLDPLREKN